MTKSLDFFGNHDLFDVGSLYPEKYITINALSTQVMSHPIWNQSFSEENHQALHGFEKTRLSGYQVSFRNIRSREGGFHMFKSASAPAPVATMAEPVAADMEMAEDVKALHQKQEAFVNNTGCVNVTAIVQLLLL